MLRQFVLLVGLNLCWCFCPAHHQLQQLQTGTVRFQTDFDSQNPLHFIQNFYYSFNGQPSIALTFHEFIATRMVFDVVSIKAETLNKHQAKFYFNHGQRHWKKVTIGYWAAHRQDLKIGQAMANLGTLQGGIKAAFVSFNSNISNPEGAVARVFFNGIGLNSGKGISVHISDDGLTPTTLRVNVKVGQETNAKEVYFSYLIFNPTTAGFASYGGGFHEVNLANKKVYDLNRIIYGSRYSFHGFMSIQLVGEESWEFVSGIDENLMMMVSTGRNIDEVTIAYIVIGVPSSSLCSNCSEGYAFRDQCVDECPTNAYVFTYGDKGKACRSCSSQFNFQLKANACSCKSGYQLHQGYCRPTQSHREFNPNLNFKGGNSFVPNEQTHAFTPQPASTPQGPSQPLQTQPLPKPEYVVKDCSQVPNTYWTGYRCACRVGYTSQNGACVRSSLMENREVFRPSEFIYKISRLYTQVTCTGQHEKVSEDHCVCVEGYERSDGGECEKKMIICPAHSMKVDGSCLCVSGYVHQVNVCIRQCPQHSVDNGVGKCVCMVGYYEHDDHCVAGKPCPPYSTRNGQGECVCNAGYTMYGEYCARCPSGQIWIDHDCVTPCGINEIFYDGECICKEGFAKYENVCTRCPAGYFIFDGFCVVCPLSSTYDGEKCVCDNGFLPSPNGLCSGQCSGQQIYDPVLQKCRCPPGLGVFNGQCVGCPFGVNELTLSCRDGCQSNQIFRNGGCFCREGYGRNAEDVCILCSDTGGFVVEEYCATCPRTFIYDGETCVCPSGTTQLLGRCALSCGVRQLLDSNGVCYYCPINQIPVNGRCQCRSGFSRGANDRCKADCDTGQITVDGLCAVCALNTRYDPVLQVCVCPQGYYKNLIGFCSLVVLPPIQCDPGFYFEDNQGCNSCVPPCQTCLDASTCTSCTEEGYIAIRGECMPNCGDGLIVGGEQCDDNNNRSGDGCSAGCQQENGFICSGLPSSCVRVAPTSVCRDGKVEGEEECDDGNFQNNDGCSFQCKEEDGWECTGSPSICTPEERANEGISIAGDIMTNFNNVFILLRTDKEYIFNSESEMKGFIKYRFMSPDTEPTSAYCLQSPSSLLEFKCLIIYASGVPNKEFQVEFSFERDGDQGYLKAHINPLANAFASRSLI